MKNIDTKQLRSHLSEYIKADTKKALVIFFADVFVYLIFLSGTLYFENIYARLLFSLLAGAKIASLFVIAHDAAHDCYTNNKALNKVIARICFLPSLHNYSLWLVAHNQLHHQYANIKGLNSWSPLSKTEYDALPKSRKVLERFYRTPFGIAFNYLIERWWKDKIFPYKRLTRKNKLSSWLDFLLVTAFFTCFMSALVLTSMQVSYTSIAETIMLSFVVPFLVWNLIVGFTVYQHHTHESIPWFKSRDDKEYSGYADEDVTMHVQYPRWYNMLSHNIMEHTAHHVDPRIPLYKLDDAQKKIAELLGEKLVKKAFSFKDFLHTMDKCKLYDYEEHSWLDFNGNKTTDRIVFADRKIEFADAA